MYAMIRRYKDNPETFEKVGQRAGTDYFPRLRQAPGLVSFYVIRESGHTHSTAITVWENEARARAFQGEEDRFDQTLKDHGQVLESRSNGEVVGHVTSVSKT